MRRRSSSWSATRRSASRAAMRSSARATVRTGKRNSEAPRTSASRRQPARSRSDSCQSGARGAPAQTVATGTPSTSTGTRAQATGDGGGTAERHRVVLAVPDHQRRRQQPLQLEPSGELRGVVAPEQGTVAHRLGEDAGHALAALPRGEHQPAARIEVVRERDHDREEAARHEHQGQQPPGEGRVRATGITARGSSGRYPSERISVRPRSEVARARNGATRSRRSGRKTTPRVRTARQVAPAHRLDRGGDAVDAQRRAGEGGAAARENTPTARGVVARARAIASSWSSTRNLPLVGGAAPLVGEAGVDRLERGVGRLGLVAEEHGEPAQLTAVEPVEVVRGEVVDRDVRGGGEHHRVPGEVHPLEPGGLLGTERARDQPEVDGAIAGRGDRRRRCRCSAPPGRAARAGRHLAGERDGQRGHRSGPGGQELGPRGEDRPRGGRGRRRRIAGAGGGRGGGAPGCVALGGSLSSARDAANPQRRGRSERVTRGEPERGGARAVARRRAPALAHPGPVALTAVRGSGNHSLNFRGGRAVEAATD